MLDIELVKKHLVSVPGDDDDLIEAYMEASIFTFETWTNRKLVATDAELPDPVGNCIVLNKSIEVGAMLLVGHWYANRETVVTGTIATALPMATESLWRPHRWVNI